MEYVPSNKIKERDIPYLEGELARNSWVVKEGLMVHILKAYPIDTSLAALDLGCGRGSTCWFLKSFFPSVHCVDLVDNRAPQFREGVTFSQLDLNFNPLPFKDSSLAFVTALQVLEHLENPFFVMREVMRVLVPGGLFVISIPNPFQISFRVKFFLTGNMPPWTKFNNHLLFLTRDVFSKTYLSLFDLIETFYQRGDVPMWGRFSKRKHLKILPRGELFARCLCYVLRRR